MRKIIAFVLLIAAGTLHAESYRFLHFGDAEGLTTPFIYTVDQAEDGHLLVGTDQGLFTYNGLRFKQVPTQHKESGFIRCSYPAEDGSIWFGHDQGQVSRYNGDVLEVIPLGEGVQSRANHVFGGAEGSVWVITQTDGIFHVQPSGAVDRYLGELDGIILYTGVAISEDTLLVGSELGLLAVALNAGEPRVEFVESLAEVAVTQIEWDGRKHLVLGTDGDGLYRMEFGAIDGTVVPEPITVEGLDVERLQINHLVADVNGELWLSTNRKGLIRLQDPQGAHYRHFIDYNEEGELGTKNIQVSFRDRERNLWVGTIGKGLLQLVDHHFALYTSSTGKDPAVHDVVADGDTLYMATSSGVSIAVKSPLNVIQELGPEQGLPVGGVHSLALGSDGGIWVGSHDSGLFHCPSGSDTFAPVVLDQDLLSAHINDILVEGNTVWVATHYGVYTLKNGAVAAHFSTAWGLPHNVVRALFRDSKGRLWVATHTFDLTYIDQEVHQLSVPEVSEVMDVTCFTEDSQGRIWVGTSGSGVIVLDEGGNRIVTKTEGLFSNSVYAIICDERNSVWMGHRNGLSRIDANEFRIEHFEQQDGLSFSPAGMDCGRSKWVWLSTNRGLMRYDPEQDYQNLVEPPVHLIGVDISDSLYTPQETIMLSAGAYRLNFQFVGISFRKRDQLRYRYILEGHDLGWSELSDQHSVRYNRLDAGTYTFKVTAFNNDGVGGEKVEQITIVIDQPFYAKWWFFAVIAGMLFVAIRFVVVRREALMKENQAYLKRELHQRTREVVEQKELLEIKNKDITDSIVYAKHIQRAIIPSPERLQDHFTESFVFYKPRDIVSGDFYWIQRFGSKVVLACADCTGHGVPGAFMSLIGSGILKQVASWPRMRSPADALSRIDLELTALLTNSEQEHHLRDGMDISLVEFDTETRKMRMSSARRPVIVYHNGERKEISGDRMSIGGGERQRKHFTLHEMTLRGGDAIYQFSDGITDQFGGRLGKKLKKQGLLSWLDEMVHLNMRHQGRMVRQQFFTWKGSQSQVDDVLLMGIRI